MTPIRKIGFSLLPTAIVLVFISCNSPRIFQKQGRISKELNLCYFNDSIQFLYCFPGDYKQFAKRKEALRELKKITIHAKRKHLLTGFMTTIPPYFEHYLLYLPYSVSLNRDFCKSNNFLAINIDRIKCNRIDTVNKKAYKVCKLEYMKGYILMIAHAQPNEYFQSLINEYTDIYGSVKNNSDYLNNLKISLFKVTNSDFYNIDNTGRVQHQMNCTLKHESTNSVTNKDTNKLRLYRNCNCFISRRYLPGKHNYRLTILNDLIAAIGKWYSLTQQNSLIMNT